MAVTVRQAFTLAAPRWQERTRHGNVAFHARAADFDPKLWELLFAIPDWKDQQYYRTLEDTLSTQGFDQGYLLLSGPDGQPRAIQPVFFVRQDLVVSLPSPVRRAAAAVRRWWPGFATTRMLMSGCVVGEWQCGAGARPDWPALGPALDAALEATARRAGVGLILWKDVPADFRRPLAPLRERRAHYARFPSPPGVRLPLECASFDEFLAVHLGKSTRKSLRRKFRESAEHTAGDPVTMEVRHELTEAEATELHRLYETVARRGTCSSRSSRGNTFSS